MIGDYYAKNAPTILHDSYLSELLCKISSLSEFGRSYATVNLHFAEQNEKLITILQSGCRSTN